MDARIHDTVLPLATAHDVPPVHFFAGGSLEHDFFESGDASGIGDIVLRAKLGITPNVAAAVDLPPAHRRLRGPAGPGRDRGQGFLILSGGRASSPPHLNVGYTYTGDPTCSASCRTSSTTGRLRRGRRDAAHGHGRPGGPLAAERRPPGEPTDHVYHYASPTSRRARSRTPEIPHGAGPRRHAQLLLLGSVGLSSTPAGRLLISRQRAVVAVEGQRPAGHGHARLPDRLQLQTNDATEPQEHREQHFRPLGQQVERLRVLPLSLRAPSCR